VYGDIEEVGEAGEEVAGTSGEGSQGPDIDSPFVFWKAQKAHDPDDCERWEDADKSNTLSAHGTTTSEVALVETYHDLAPTMFASGAGVERVASAGSEAQFIVGAIQQVQWASGGGKVLNDSAQTLRSGAEHNYQFLNTAIPRRLTPTECERLQGFPDDWTRYADDGTELADGPRYRMMGNAVTVNVAEWIGRRLPSEEG
jgi:site-specific DNA-cytosine methylase